MAWPTAHRNGGALARQGGGFETRGFQPRSTPYSPIRTPLGPPPVPGNDNLPWRPPPPAGLPLGNVAVAVVKVAAVVSAAMSGAISGCAV